MRLTIVSTFVLLTLGCAKRPAELSEECKQIIESDSFYYAVAFPEMETQFDAMWRLDNFLTSSNDSEAQIIDFDCLVSVNPTNEKLEELKKIDEEDFQETLRITIKHIAATKCVAESNGVQFIDARGQLFRFKTVNQTWDLDMQKDKFSGWKFILFRKGKETKIVPNVRMTFDQFNEYFQIKNADSR